MEKSASQSNPLPQPRQQSPELALGESLSEGKSLRNWGGAVAFTPTRGGGKGPGTKSLPTELGAVCHLKGTFCCGRGAAGCALLPLAGAGVTA